jgi:hypothetical protein
MNALRCIGWLIACAAVTATGCNPQTTGNETEDGTGRNRDPQVLVAKNRPPIPDLPVPLGFEIDERRSHHLTTGPFRQVNHVYTGDADRFAVTRFYRTQMPINGWSPVRESFAQGAVSMDFDKGDERCNIMIMEGQGWGNPVEIRVWLSFSGKIQSNRSGEMGS